MRWVWLCLMIALSGVAWAQPVALEGEQLARYHALNAEVRCVICQNRSIAESDVPLAQDLRAIIAEQIAAGRSDAQIKQYLVDRYGTWVLYDPPLTTETLVLWLGPFVLLGIGLLVVWLVMRRRAGTASAPSVDRARLSALIDDDDENRKTSERS